MSKVLSDTKAISGKSVNETANPDYSGFHSRSHKALCNPMRNTNAGGESLRHAVQCLESRRPGE
jgi:hypothetical protein